MQGPAMIAYSAHPNEYMVNHADEIRGLYDGFYFPAGSWDQAVSRLLGTDSPPEDSAWLPFMQRTIDALRVEGITENFLGVSFGSNDPWPSSDTILSTEYTAKFHRHFSAIGEVAKKLGFRGVSIDTEYPYPRYDLSHEIYTYDGYTPGELMIAVHRQGYACLGAILDQFPEAVILHLPGGLRVRPLAREFILGFLDCMTDRDASGGFHVATEYAYSLHDPVTQVAIPRYEDAAIETVLSDRMADYWKRRCTIAPGMWPYHMAETGGEGYPIRPWKEELAELRDQYGILRTLSKKYIWSYSGHPAWIHPKHEDAATIASWKKGFEGDVEATEGWQAILREKPDLPDPKLQRLVDTIHAFDAGDLSSQELTDVFATPHAWWVLGMLGNPHTNPARAVKEALDQDVDPRRAWYGRGGPVRWFPWTVADPRGIHDMRTIFDAVETDDVSAHLVCWMQSETARDATLWLGWDDGLQFWIGDNLVFDRPGYPDVGHGAQYLDRYQFEEKIGVHIPAGTTRLAATSINAIGPWQFQIRFTDNEGYPLEGICFTIEVP
jgi:hypothetical protein